MLLTAGFSLCINHLINFLHQITTRTNSRDGQDTFVVRNKHHKKYIQYL